MNDVDYEVKKVEELDYDKESKELKLGVTLLKTTNVESVELTLDIPNDKE